MRLGLNIGYSGSKMELPLALVQEADRLGYHSVWTSESYGSDAVTPLTWLGAHTQRIKLGTGILQMPGRTPANTAMTAMTLDQLSGGRVLLGLGLSGPQVVEGWHGVPYGKPLVKTREYVEIVRKIMRREAPLEFTGEHYTIPYRGDDATGLGKPLKSILAPAPHIPIYLAAIGPKNVQLAAEIADGWLPIFFAPEHYDTVFREAVEAGVGKHQPHPQPLSKLERGLSSDEARLVPTPLSVPERGRGEVSPFDIAPAVTVIIDDDLQSARDRVRPQIALYVGGMGARGRNFYYDLAARYGYEDAAAKIQDLYLAGNKIEAMMAVPDDLIDAVALVGSRARIADRLALWKASPLTTLIVSVYSVDDLRAMAEMCL
jgi:alkanesulfonate monooxygenase SsuD/methylene tetrahydromethanopterin reductase-like flavin-dependent oxidoreductase (luciferase family)